MLGLPTHCPMVPSIQAWGIPSTAFEWPPPGNLEGDILNGDILWGWGSIESVPCQIDLDPLDFCWPHRSKTEDNPSPIFPAAHPPLDFPLLLCSQLWYTHHRPIGRIAFLWIAL